MGRLIFAPSPRTRPRYGVRAGNGIHFADATQERPQMNVSPRFPQNPLLRLAAAAVVIGLVGLPASADEAPTTQPAAQPAADAAAMPSAKDVLQKYVDATGGEAAYKALTGQKAVGTFSMPAQGLTGQLELFQKSPDKMLAVVNIPPFGTVERGVNGTVGWMVDDRNGPQLLDDATRQGMLRDADAQSNLTPDKYYASVEVKGKEDVDGKPAYHLHFTPKEGGSPVDSFYDVESGLLVKSVTEVDTPAGKMSSETVLSDYREIGTGAAKLKVPFKIVATAAGQEQVIELSEVTVNPETPDDKFKVPDEVKALEKDKPDAGKM